MPKLTFRSRIYRFLFERMLTSKLLRGVESDQWKEESLSLKHGKETRVIWFHAASAGELEGLWPVILASAQEGYRLCVSVFSESASRSLVKLRGALEDYPGSLLYSGLSPWEGQWEAALRFFRPSVFVTAKYEAWPDLWLSLALLETPLVVVGAKARRSFVACKFLLRLLGMPLPHLVLLTVEESELEALQKIFPQAQMGVSGDPRWDQVKARSAREQPRVLELCRQFENCPKPWGVLAQVWKEDLQVWADSLVKLPGTVWVVPHRLDEGTVSEISSFLSATGKDWVRSSVPSDAGSKTPKFILLDEMGILLELYRWVDWAYVGGGMGRGVHSTIEPAIHGIPISIGPQGAMKFPEIAQLIKAGQLTLIPRSDHRSMSLAVGRWLGDALDPSHTSQAKANREKWIRDSDQRMGATKSILAALSRIQERQPGDPV